MRLASSRALLCVFSLLLVVMDHSHAPAQQPGIFGLPTAQVDTPSTPRMNAARDEWGSGAAAPRGPLLDRPISRTDYNLGPGDILSVSVLGYSDRLFQVTVTPEGTIVVPTVGVVRVGGLNLDQAQRRVAGEVRRFYTSADVALSLLAVRSFKIFVVGAVPDPGIREATAVTRVSELVPHVTSSGITRRNIVVRRADGEALTVDLVRFLRSGELSENPVVREGDVVHVPMVDETITLSGEVAFPGTYEYRAGESLAELLQVANGYAGFPAGAADTLWLMRFTGGAQGEIERIARDDAIGALGSTIPMQPFDAVFAPRLSNFKERTVATIRGEVVRPGIYPVQPNVTTVRDLVQMAGGFTEEASLIDAVLRRQPVPLATDRMQFLTNVPPEMLTVEERRVLQVTQRADDRNVVVDFASLFAEGELAYDLPLQDGDDLVVPERRDQVVVLGAVIQPGILNHREGAGIDHFVDMAGGYSRRADRGDVVVIKARLGSRLHRGDVQTIEPGDQIIVPFREPATFMDRVTTAQVVLNTVSGLVLTVIGLQRLWN